METEPIAKAVWNRGHTECGIVIGVTSRYCAACESGHRCLIVEWPNGKRTKPCTKGMKRLSDAEWEIL